jgi:hypothetical protein
MEAINKKTQGFKPGEGGRPKGVKNKITREIQAKVEWVLEMLDETIEDDLQKMKPPERVKLWTDLQEYIRPKLQRVNLDVGPEDKEITRITFEVVSAAGSGDEPNVKTGNG